jgi:hypothetical protein
VGLVLSRVGLVLSRLVWIRVGRLSRVSRFEPGESI